MCRCRTRKCICSCSWARWRSGTILGGPIGDRVGRKYVIWCSILGILPFTLAMPYVNLFWTVVLSAIIGTILASAFPAIVVYAQELLPGKVGMISGLFFGLAFGTAGIAAALLGELADYTSIAFVYRACAFMPLLGLADRIPSRHRRRDAAGRENARRRSCRLGSPYRECFNRHTMRIAGAGSAFPKHYYPQAVLLAALREYWKGQIENPRMLDQLHAHAGVDGRHLVLPLERYYGLKNFGEFNQVWIEAAQELGERAIRCAMARAGLELSQIGALFFVSVTGVASPSIDARLINRMKLPTNLRRTPIFGLGCVAGAAGVARAADYVRAYPDQVAVLLSVELCSLTLQREDLSLANLVSSGLFGDGAAAVVIAGADVKRP